MENPTRINLTDLRADAGAIIDDGSWLHGKTYLDPDDLLALIDVAEAARPLADYANSKYVYADVRVEELQTLRDALTRFS